MKPETIDTITRHLKGIVAALEKEKSWITLVDSGTVPKGEVHFIQDGKCKGKIINAGG